MNLLQTKLELLSNSRYRVKIRQNNFIAGTIDLNEKTFTHSPRSPKNLFRIFNNSLGINAEIVNVICPHFGIKKILIPYQDTLLESTPENWIQHGIVSPYCDERVDKQLLMPIDQLISSPVVNVNSRVSSQLSLEFS